MRKFTFLYIFVVIVLGTVRNGNCQMSYTITTVAGNNTTNKLGDGGIATNAFLFNPTSVFVTDSGCMYIADWLNNRIRKVNQSGIISTVAGNGVKGYSGDGGPALKAALNGPSGVYLDASGNIYIADCGNERIRKINTSGTITTIAGNGNFAYTGDGGPATNASLKGPTQVIADTLGNVYIADVFNACVRMVNPAGIISTIAGTGIPGFSGDGGPSNVAQLYYPSGIALGDSGKIYIADAGNSRIRMVDKKGIITTIAGNGNPGYAGDEGQASAALLNYPAEVATDDSGNIYISDSYNDRIRMINRQGIISTIAGNGIQKYSGDGGPATNASFYNPYQLFADKTGNVFVSDMFNDCVRKLTPNGDALNTVTKVSIYPNPNNGTFTVDVPAKWSNARFVVYNVLGQQITDIQFASTSTIVNLGVLSHGMYLYRLISIEGSDAAKGKLILK